MSTFERIKYLRKIGYTIRDIAYILDISYSSVYRTVKKQEHISFKRIIGIEKSDLIQKVYLIKEKNNLSNKQLSIQLGVSIQTISRWLNGKVSPKKYMKHKIKFFIKKHLTN